MIIVVSDEPDWCRAGLPPTTPARGLPILYSADAADAGADAAAFDFVALSLADHAVFVMETFGYTATLGTPGRVFMPEAATESGFQGFIAREVARMAANGTNSGRISFLKVSF